MKKKVLGFLSLLLIFLISCEKTTHDDIEPLLDDFSDAQDVLQHTDTIRLFNDTGDLYVDILVSSNNSDVLLNGLLMYNLYLNIDSNENNDNSQIANNEKHDDYKDFSDFLIDDSYKPLEELEELRLEVIQESSGIGDYAISFRVNESKIKSTWIPPSNYYIGYRTKANRKYLGIKYFPVTGDNSGIIYKWGYREKWYSRFRWDENWRVIQGSVSYEIERQNPSSNKGYRRLGLSLYTNTYSNIDVKESNNPITW